MSTVTQLIPGSHHIGLDIGLSSASAYRDPEAWKKLIGQKPVNARLATLPERPIRRSALLTSTLFQAAVAAFLVVLPMVFPQRLATIVYHVTPIAAPDTSIPLPLPQRQQAVRPKIQPTQIPPPVEEPQPTRVARLITPRQLAAPRPRTMDIQNQEAPRFEQPLLEARFEVPMAEPSRPREPVKLGNLTTGSAAPATVDRPLDKVQTGGFGDPRGLPGESNPNKRANIARQGSLLLPGGPGYGNGTGGASGVRGTVASAGFGNGIAIPPPGGSGGTARGPVRAGGFATAEVGTTDAPRARQAENTAAVQPVVILAKPNPLYTDEARKLAIEGEVLLEVVFPASGPLKVIRVVKGLGHGLDEAAIRAAQGIRFKPASQNGSAVDFPATVHIVFQLAF